MVVKSDRFHERKREFEELAVELEEHDSIFRTLWELGRPTFTETIETAAISFDQVGKKVEFLFHPDFWDSLSRYERAFVVAHEILHVLLQHGKRATNYKSKNAQEIWNIATDIAINETLIRGFGFEKNRLPCAENAMFVDTVFSKHSDISPRLSAEMYVSKIEKLPKEQRINLLTLDLHLFENIDPKILEDILKELLDKTPDKERRNFQQKCQKGGESSKLSNFVVNPGNVNKSIQWLKVIRRWAKRKISESLEQKWGFPNRRLQAFSETFLPVEHDSRGGKGQSIRVAFFVDASGSCRNLSKDFIRAAKSLPDEYFDAQFFAFSNKVFEIDMKQKNPRLSTTGGTNFSCIVKHVRKMDPQPEAIFVLTDGYASKVVVDSPKDWYWFLTTDNTRAIPNDCNIYKLRNFE